MAFDNLYHLNKQEIDEVYKKFAIAFLDDDLYCALYQNEKKRSLFLHFFFKHYLKSIRPYCYFVADSKAMNSVMVLFDSKKESRNYMLRVAWLNVNIVCYAIRIHSFTGIRHMMSLWEMFTSNWVNDFVNEDYFHMDLLYTKKEMRGKGIATHMMNEVIDEALKQCVDITMETHHEDNLRLYEQVGFKIMSKASHESYAVTQYNLLYRKKE